MLYGTDVFGYRTTKCRTVYNEMISDVFEKCHLRFCRYILGVNKFATKIGIYGETGRLPICIDSIVAFIRYWFRLEKGNGTHDLLQQAFLI